jgi:hypothetical protein
MCESSPWSGNLKKLLRYPQQFAFLRIPIEVNKDSGDVNNGSGRM